MVKGTYSRVRQWRVATKDHKKWLSCAAAAQADPFKTSIIKSEGNGWGGGEMVGQNLRDEKCWAEDFLFCQSHT